MSHGLLQIAAAILLVAGMAADATANDCPYSYLDDFSTEKAAIDSEYHSLMMYQLPGVHMWGVLVYEEDETGNRGLGFHGGFQVDAPAKLYYRMPLVPTSGSGVAAGQLEFDLEELSSPVYFRVKIIADDITIHNEVIAAPGPYQIAISPAAAIEQISIRFTGDRCVLDNLSVCLETATQIVQVTWGKVKAHYR